MLGGTQRLSGHFPPWPLPYSVCSYQESEDVVLCWHSLQICSNSWWNGSSAQKRDIRRTRPGTFPVCCLPLPRGESFFIAWSSSHTSGEVRQRSVSACHKTCFARLRSAQTQCLQVPGEKSQSLLNCWERQESVSH